MIRVDRGERLIAAPAGRIYAALLDPAAIVRWRPPDGAQGAVDALEPRIGGAFRMALRFATAAGKTSADTDRIVARFTDLAAFVED